MRLLQALILISIFSHQARAACGLQGATSAQNLLQIAKLVKAPASADLSAPLISGSSGLVITNAQGENVKIDEALGLTPGMSISTTTNKAVIYLPTTGQTIELSPQTTIKVLHENKSSDQKICSLSFELKNGGRATFTSDHLAREKHCKPANKNAFETATSTVEITPIGTKYSVDLNQAIAELNGETVEADENISVEKGAVQVRLVKIKKPSRNKLAKGKKLDIASVESLDDGRPVEIKAGQKAKVKKNKKDRMADIQIVYPEQ